ncbi:MAG TPA: hypothetical protein VNI55_03415 [Gaiellaceae bacterium]|nr:hypothetical protein [Gaiellaceae bacterium]
MVLARGLAAGILAALGLALVPGIDWAFQLVYPLALALGAASVRWWPIAILLLLPLWSGLDYAIEPFEESDSVDSAGEAALFGLLIAVPIGAVAFAVGKALRAFALALGSQQNSSS